MRRSRISIILFTIVILLNQFSKATNQPNVPKATEVKPEIKTEAKTEMKPVEVKGNEVKAEVKVEVKTEVKVVEVKTEVKAAEVKTEAKPNATKPAAQPTEVNPATNPVEVKPAEVKPITQPTPTKPNETKPVAQPITPKPENQPKPNAPSDNQPKPENQPKPVNDQLTQTAKQKEIILLNQIREARAIFISKQQEIIRTLNNQLQPIITSIAQLKDEKLLVQQSLPYKRILDQITKDSIELKELETKLVSLNESFHLLANVDHFEHLCNEYSAILSKDNDNSIKQNGPIRISYLQRARLANNLTRLEEIHLSTSEKIKKILDQIEKNYREYEELKGQVDKLNEKIYELEQRRNRIRRKIGIEEWKIKRQSIANNYDEPSQQGISRDWFLEDYDISGDEQQQQQEKGGEEENKIKKKKKKEWRDATEEGEREYQELVSIGEMEFGNDFFVLSETREVVKIMGVRD